MDSLVNAFHIFEEAQQKLSAGYDEQESGALTRWLMEDLLLIRKTDIALRTSFSPDPKKFDLFETALQRVRAGEPIQYVLGYTEFLGLRFHVAPGVLIPRPETEELVVKVSEENPKAKTILDIGTGSGCIAISLARQLAEARVIAWDVKEEALNIAKENALQLHAQVQFERVDVLQSWPSVPDEKPDVIVSNPPYIRESEKKQMRSNVLDHEPEVALFVPENDPLLFYRHISEKARRYLSPGGKLYFEINEGFEPEMVDLLQGLQYEQVEVTQDLQQKPRMLSAVAPSDR